MIYSKDQFIGEYKVIFPIKKSSYAETYRVKNNQGKTFFLKLFNYAQLHHSQFDGNEGILEITLSQKLAHSNIISYHDHGDIVQNGMKLGYLVQEFISGETVAEKLARENISVFEAKQIILQVLEGLEYMHSIENGIIHNEITIQNVMLDMSHSPYVAKIIDLGHARYFEQKRTSFDKRGINLFTIAPEAMNGIFTVQSDIYSVGAMLYQMIFKIPPHFIDLSDYQKNQQDIEDAILNERETPLKFPNMDIFELDDNLINIMEKALSNNVDERFKSSKEFAQALKGELKIESSTHSVNDKNDKGNNVQKNVKKGNGFKDVAGMDELKQRMKDEVIDLIQHPEENKALGIPMPNGILLYGPPGCGKTYFAEKFAEESGYNYMYIKCSDVASPYIHGGQEKIAAVFEKARKNAPTILFLDEIEAMIMSRDKHNNVSESGEVNEFLTQLNNCGETGVLVIGATNQPNNIDVAALRAGRLEMKYYIPNPDDSTRNQLLHLYLEYRADFGIDYDYLVSKTINFVSSDIRLFADNAARKTRKVGKKKITMDILKEVLDEFKPTVTKSEIEKYEKIRDEFEGKKSASERPRIGFC